MKLPTIKYPSGQEVSLAAFLLQMSTRDVGQARRRSLNQDSSGVPDAGTPSSHHQKEEQHERRSFQG